MSYNSNSTFNLGAISNSPATISYDSSNISVATVTARGQVNSSGIGTTIITLSQGSTDIYTSSDLKINLTFTSG